MNTVIAATCFTWLGMILAISFLEAPLKFRAPDVTVRIGLGIGRIVFRWLNALELLLAVLVLVAALVGGVHGLALVSLIVLLVLLGVQLGAVRPWLNRRSDRVLASEEELPRSHAHLVYIALELVKVSALIWLGVQTI